MAMADEQKPNKGQFKPGWKGGPGRPKLPEEVREGRRLTAESFQKLIDKCYYLSLDELKERAQDGSLHAIERMVIKIIIKSEEGSLSHGSFLIERMIGPIPKEIKAQLNGNLHGQLVAAIKQATTEGNGEDGDV